MKIIVICTGNTCRSQIAEGLLKAKYPNFDIYSAGTKPEKIVNQFAVKAMAEEGYDISTQYPKLVSDFIEEPFDFPTPINPRPGISISLGRGSNCFFV